MVSFTACLTSSIFQQKKIGFNDELTKTKVVVEPKARETDEDGSA